MNILYLKYVVEVAKSGSISKAAGVLFVAQPNISRAIRGLESSLGITIFDRTSKGMTPTEDGKKLIEYAQRILSQIDEAESYFKNQEKRKRNPFSVSAPRASYISEAFARFTLQFSPDTSIGIRYTEADAFQTVTNVLENDYQLGILRYDESYDRFFREMAKEKELIGETIAEFSPVLLMSCRHCLATQNEVTLRDLSSYIEVTLTESCKSPTHDGSDTEILDEKNAHISVSDHDALYRILAVNANTYAWVSGQPHSVTEEYGLTEKICTDSKTVWKDVLIYRSDYHLTGPDKDFITELCKAKRKYL